jgi:hypothetical protein
MTENVATMYKHQQKYRPSIELQRVQSEITTGELLSTLEKHVASKEKEIEVEREKEQNLNSLGRSI